MKDQERDALFSRARSEATPTDDDRRRVRAALNRRIGAAAAGAAVGVTAAKAAASVTPATAATAAAATATAVPVAAAGVSAMTILKAAAIVLAVGGAVTVLPVRPPRFSAPASPAASAPHVVIAAPGNPSAPLVQRSPSSIPPPPPPPPPSPPSDDDVPVVVLPAAQGDLPLPSPAGAMPRSTTRTVTPQAAPLPVSPSALGAATAPQTGAASAPEADSADDLALVKEMQVALRTGDSPRVLALVREHERRFPASTLAPEREGARVIALCSGAEPVEAGKIGQAFVDTYPRSPLVGRVRATCGLRGEGR